MLKKLSVATGLCLAPGLAVAQSLDSGDTAWILTSTALVLFMTLPGLSLFYGGLVRTKNILSVLMQCFAIACMVSLLWLVGVYSLSFAEGSNWIGDLSKAFFSGIGKDTMSGSIPEVLFIMFQLTFAIITPALIVGAFAERMKFSSMLIFSGLWVILVYAPLCHWVWGGGWLADRGIMDFAGGIVVHISAGVAALVCALSMGNRRGFPTTAMPPHNMTMTVTGAGMLWVGWFGFNAGSALAANGDAAMAMLVTHISAAAGSLAWMIMEWFRYGKPSVLGIVTGMVAGLGTITPCSGFVGPGGALIIGLVAGVTCFTATQLMKNKFKIDDSLDVFPVHGIGGILGTLLVAIFASPNLGVFSGQGNGSETYSIVSQFQVQAIGVLAAVAFTAIATFILLKLTGFITAGVRVTEEQETQGLDIVLHEESGYNY